MDRPKTDISRHTHIQTQTNTQRQAEKVFSRSGHNSWVRFLATLFYLVTPGGPGPKRKWLVSDFFPQPKFSLERLVAFGVASICLLNLRQISFNGVRLLGMVVAYFYTLYFFVDACFKSFSNGGLKVIRLLI